MPVIRANVVDLAPGFMLGEIIPFHDVLDIMKLSRDELVAAVTVPAGKKGKTAEKAKKLELIEEMAKRFVISYADWSTGRTCLGPLPISARMEKKRNLAALRKFFGDPVACDGIALLGFDEDAPAPKKARHDR
jgi:hypothetical protein